MLAVARYWGTVLHEAAKEVRDFFRPFLQGLVRSALLFGIALVLLERVLTGPDNLQAVDELRWGVATAGAVPLTGLVLFLAAIIRIPALLHNDLLADLDSLKPDMDVILDRLEAHHVFSNDCGIEKEGVYVVIPRVELFNRRPDTEVELDLALKLADGERTDWLRLEATDLSGSIGYRLNRDDRQGQQLIRPVVPAQGRTTIGWPVFFVPPEIRSRLGGDDLDSVSACLLRVRDRQTLTTITELELSLSPLIPKSATSSSIPTAAAPTYRN